VSKLLADPHLAPAHADAILAYYRALPKLAGESEVKDLLTLAGNAALPVPKRIAIVEAMPEFVHTMSNELRKNVDPVLSSGDGKLVEAGQVFLVILGDKRAKKELLKPYDNVVEGNPRWSQAFARRAAILFRIQEYDDAIKDYMMALKNGENEAAPQPDTYIGLARCHARRGRLKEASDWLRKAPIQIAQLKLLANDPDFAKVKEHPKYGEVFGRD
jgi:tetratricopeptide (TPR) repeat protein